MAKNTARDRLWTFAIKRCVRDREHITATELAAMAGTTERSARDCLKTMHQKDILKMIESNGKTVYERDLRTPE
jgi:MarR-like DNA-binding transcriptional regulator SgrR of sgrS sRNA